jgi:hypothetical protein
MNIKHEVNGSKPPGPVISKYFTTNVVERIEQPRLDESNIGVLDLAARSGTEEARAG